MRPPVNDIGVCRYRWWRHEAPIFRLLCLFVTLSISPLLHANWLSETRQMMGTEVSVELWSVDEKAGRIAIEQAMAEIQRLDLMVNPWNSSSELARINREAANGVGRCENLDGIWYNLRLLESHCCLFARRN